MPHSLLSTGLSKEFVGRGIPILFGRRADTGFTEALSASTDRGSPLQKMAISKRVEAPDDC